MVRKKSTTGKLLIGIAIVAGAAIAAVLIMLYIFGQEDDTGKSVVAQIENFKQVKGHYPNCKNVNELADSLGLNLNLIETDSLVYNLDKLKGGYILEVKQDKHTRFYNSKTRKWRRLYH